MEVIQTRNIGGAPIASVIDDEGGKTRPVTVRRTITLASLVTNGGLLESLSSMMSRFGGIMEERC